MFQKIRGIGIFISVAFVVSLSMQVTAQDVYKEEGGIVVMEMENTKSDLGLWVKKSDGSGWTGTGFLEFTGNSQSGGSVDSPLLFKFKITKAGTYGIYLHAYNRLDGAATDLCNDAYVKMAGDFTSGNSSVTLAALTADTKLYSSNGGNVWAWGQNLDGPGADHKQAKYVFKSGEEYLLTVSGRSQRFQIDRILFAHSDVAVATAKNITTESGFVDATAILSKSSEAHRSMPSRLVGNNLTFSVPNPGNYAFYLNSLSGKTIYSGNANAASNGSVSVVLNSTNIGNGTYVATIKGTNYSANSIVAKTAQ